MVPPESSDARSASDPPKSGAGNAPPENPSILPAEQGAAPSEIPGAEDPPDDLVWAAAMGALFRARPELPADRSDPRERLEKIRTRGGSTDRYRYERSIGRGGQGAVFEVWDEDLSRRAAMKVVMKREVGPSTGGTPPVDPGTLSRFLEEAQVTGQLDHPGVVPVYEIGVESTGQVYFTMRLVEGQNLAQIFELVHTGNDGWSQASAVGVLLKVCEAMAYAHSKGVIHRDLKPANIMVGNFGEVYVMDWGLARVLGKEETRDIRLRPAPEKPPVMVRTDRRMASAAESPLLTMDGDVVGTPAYMSPEQAQGDLAAMGPHSDVYSVGAILYHLLAGHMPYVPPKSRLLAYSVLGMVLDGPPAPLETITKSAPAELVSICEKAMARDPSLRYPDTQALATDLRAYLEGRVVQAHRTGPWIETTKWVRRNRVLTAAGVLLLLVLTGGFVTTMVESARASRENQRFRQLADVKIFRDLQSELRGFEFRTPEQLEFLADWSGRAEELVSRRPEHLRALSQVRSQMSAQSEDPSLEFLHAALVELDQPVAEMERFLLLTKRALEYGRQSLDDPRWMEIQRDVPEVHAPDPGLVPLGKNAQGLWEFWHHQSGERPTELVDLSTIEDWPVARWASEQGVSMKTFRAAASRWRVDASTGLVLVLVPTGPVRPGGDVDVPAIFISKYELTRGQWERLTGHDPSLHSGVPKSSPVDRVNWFDAEEHLPRWDLALPRNSEWERAARGGTATKWWTGDEEAQVATGGKIAPQEVPGPDPVGRYRANPFGLHDTIGNLFEWSGSPTGLDRNRTKSRGGSYRLPEEHAKSAYSGWNPPRLRDYNLGVRPIRSVSSLRE